MRKLQKIAAGIPTVSQDTMLNIHDEARSRKMSSINMACKETMGGKKDDYYKNLCFHRYSEFKKQIIINVI